MTDPPVGSSTESSRHLLASGCALGAVVMGVVVLTGWTTDLTVLMSVVPGQATMKVNTAVCLVLLGAAATVRRRGLATGAASLTLALSLAVLSQHVWGIDLGVDELLFDDATDPTLNTPGRMASVTATCLAVLAASEVLLRLGRDRVAELLALVTAYLGCLAIWGYLYSAETLYAVGSLSTMAINTAVGLVLVSVSILARSPRSLLAWAMGPGPGPTLLRRTVPASTAMITVLGLLRIRAGDAGWFDERFGVALMVSVGSLAVAAVTTRAARDLQRSDDLRRAAFDRLREVNAGLVRGRDAEWRRAEDLAAELQRKRAAFELAVSRSDDLVWTAELGPGRDVTFVYTSPNAHGVTGVADIDPERLRRLLADGLDHESRETVGRFWTGLRHGRSEDARFRLTGRDGIERWIWARATARPGHDGRVMADGILTNVSRQQELERLRDEFIAVAGHELRTPLAVVRGYCEVLTVTDEPTQVDAAVEAIVRRVDQLTELVNDLFDLARLDTGALPLRRTSVRLDRVVEEAVADVIAATAGPRAEVSLDLVPARVDVDDVRLRQVVDNLLSNALKYTPADGAVSLRLRHEGPCAVLEVADTGIGVAPEERHRLFDRFFRSSAARRSGATGTGLGLSVARALATAHEGSLTFEPNAPSGSVFRLALPTTPPSQHDPAGSEP